MRQDMLLEVHTSKLFHCIACFQDCNEEDCPVDCTISDWQDVPMTKLQLQSRLSQQVEVEGFGVK